MQHCDPRVSCPPPLPFRPTSGDDVRSWLELATEGSLQVSRGLCLPMYHHHLRSALINNHNKHCAQNTKIIVIITIPVHRMISPEQKLFLHLGAYFLLMTQIIVDTDRHK
ncbi:hypothetical protein PoB_007248600 [Plakobranchus ocellatus]|uniref:Uncharacterized protein n=1 Tax=Plakobranchus ocellatus TaxID=259542 RepID=A0AAV4DPE1_9GAST|nr:hypothetical protein PoB_007248600 [Plakobranchus ocellatus]